MKKMMIAVGFGAILVSSGSVFASEQTVKLVVKNITCSSFKYIVKEAFIRVPGVSNVVVSFDEKSADVTFDDNITNLEQLIKAVIDNESLSLVLQEQTDN